jgi:hypothetical protein
MSTAAKLHRTGQLQIAGNIYEDLPPVQDGLVLHWPLKQNLNGIWVPEIDHDIDTVILPNNWVPGTTGSQSGFYQNGDGNSIIWADDPWGRVVPVWRSYKNDAASNADGGWNTSYYNVAGQDDVTWRFSVWERRLGNLQHGASYLGLYATWTGESQGVLNLGTETATSNPYFYSSSSWFGFNEWFLIVGHLRPYSYSSSTKHADTGIWELDGTKRSTPRDFRMKNAPISSLKHRAYLYYSNQPQTNQQWVYPRMEACDGTEPSLEDLLTGRAYGVHTPIQYSNLRKIHGIGWAVDGPADNVSDQSIDENDGNAWGGMHGTYNGYTTTRTVITDFSEQGREHVLRSEETYVDGNTYGHLRVDMNTTCVQGDYVTCSLDYKGVPAEGGDRVVSPSRISFSSLYADGWKVPNTTDVLINQVVTRIPLGDGWYRLTCTGTYNYASGTPTARFGIGCDEPDKNIWYFDNIKLEKNSHMSSFTNPSGSKGRLDIPMTDIGTGNFTVFGKMLPLSQWADSMGNYVYTSNQAALFSIYDETAGEYVHVRYYAAGSNPAPFIDPDVNSVWSNLGTTNHHHQTYTLNAYEDVYFAIRRTSSTQLKCKLWQDGGWKGEHVLNNVTAAASADQLQFGNTTLWEGVRSDISIYDRSLSDAELDKLVQHGLSLTSEGDAHNRIDETAFGPNLWPYANLNTNYSASSGGTLTNEDYAYHQLVLSGGTYGYRGTTVPTDASSYYIVTGEFWKGSDSVSPWLIWRAERSAGNLNGPPWSSIGTETWTRVNWIFESDTDAGTLMLIYPGSNSLACEGTYRWRNIQMRKIPSEAMKMHKDGLIDIGEIIEGID